MTTNTQVITARPPHGGSKDARNTPAGKALIRAASVAIRDAYAAADEARNDNPQLNEQLCNLYSRHLNYMHDPFTMRDLYDLCGIDTEEAAAITARFAARNMHGSGAPALRRIDY